MAQKNDSLRQLVDAGPAQLIRSLADELNVGYFGWGKRMALMTFGKNYSVGVQTIDDQHKVLFDIINSLYEGMMTGQARSLTGPLLKKLADYTRNHFTAEEALMTAAKYPQLSAHKIKHRDLVKQVEDYIARYDRGETTLNIQLLNFLRDWLTNHIQKEDKQYSHCMIEHGIH